MSVAIGIDLGTTNCCVAYYIENHCKTIKIDGNRLLKSRVFYSLTDDKIYVGDKADKEMIKLVKIDGELVPTTSNLIYDAKRFIASRYDDDFITNNKEKYPFNILKDEDTGYTMFSCKHNNEDLSIFPEDVSAKILTKIKEEASKELDQEDIEAVITVPANFTTRQKELTKKAAEKAGIKVLKLMTEPTAAALFYFNQLKITGGNALVFDFGGGTLDVSIIDLGEMVSNNDILMEGSMKVVGVNGDNFLGGRDIDENIVRCFKEVCEKQRVEIDYRIEKRLRTIAEECKKQLSIGESYTHTFITTSEIELEMDKEKYEELNKEIFDKCVEVTLKCLEKCGLAKNDIDQVVLVGGSSRIPKLSEILQYHLNLNVKSDNDADEIVAQGAALYAHILKTNEDDGNEDDVVSATNYNDKECAKETTFNIIDVVSMPIGIALKYDCMDILIKANTPYPFNTKHSVVTTNNNQSSMSIKIYEGGSKYVHNNTFLAELEITDLPLGPSGSVKADLEVDIDEFGIIKFTATSENKTEELTLTVNKNKLQLTESRVVNEDIFEKIVTAKAIINHFCNIYINIDPGRTQMFKEFNDSIGNYEVIDDKESMEYWISTQLEIVENENFKRSLKSNFKKIGFNIDI